MFKIHFEINENELKELAISNSVTLNAEGKLYLEVNGKYYPNTSWMDYPFILTMMWIEDSITLLNEGTSELTFMEGPFSIYLNKLNNKKLRITFYNRSKPSGNRNFEIKLKDYLKELLSVSKKLIKLADKYEIKKNIDLAQFKLLSKKLYQESVRYE